MALIIKSKSMLTDNDRQRIEQEAVKRYGHTIEVAINTQYDVFIEAAEYATIYEREQQAKELPDGIVYVIKGKYYIESSERVQDGDTLHCVVHGQVSASTEQKIGFGDTCTVNLHWDRVNFDNGEKYVYWPDKFKKLKQLEAERSELLNKLQERLERCRKVSGYSSGFSDIHNEIDFLDLLLNSLKTK